MLYRTAHLRFLFRGSSTRNIFCIRNYVTSNQERMSEIANLYGITEPEAKEMMRQNRILQTIDFKRLEKQLGILRNLKIETKDIQKTPKIATLVSGRLKNRYYCLLELGFKDLTVDDIVKFTDTIRGSIRSHTITWDPIEVICSSVEGPENLKTIIQTKYMNKSSMTLIELHRIVVLEYLIWKLNLSQTEVMSIIAKYPSLASSSIKNLKDVINLLINDYKFTIEKIQANGFLLVLSLESADRLISENPVLGGIPIKQFVLRFPRVLTSDSKNVQQVAEYLRQFDITNEQILTTGNIYTLNTTTLLKRLEAYKLHPEMVNLKNTRCFLELIYYFEKAVKRLLYLRQFNIISLELLICSENRFKKIFAAHCKSKKRRDISLLLSEKYDLSFERVFTKLNYRGNLKWWEVDLKEVEKTFKYLLKHFTETKILNNLPVVLFDVKIVKEFVNETPVLEVVQEKLFAQLPVENSDDDSNSQLKYGKMSSKSKLSLSTYLNPRVGGRKK